MRGFKAVAALAAQAADDKKGEDIALLDVRRASGLTDYLLLVSVTSPAHLEAVEGEIERAMETAGVARVHLDGRDSGLWKVLDYGGLIVHLMHPEARDFYQLEKLYHAAPRRPWRAEKRAPKARSRRRA